MVSTQGRFGADPRSVTTRKTCGSWPEYRPNLAHRAKVPARSRISRDVRPSPAAGLDQVLYGPAGLLRSNGPPQAVPRSRRAQHSRRGAVRGVAEGARFARDHHPARREGASGRRTGGHGVRHRRGSTRQGGFRAQGRRPVAGRDGRRIPRRGHGVGEGAADRGRPVRRPGGDHGPHPVRVDAVRLRAVDHRRAAGAGLPDVLLRPGALDAARLRGGGLRRRARGPRDDGRRGRRPTAAADPAVADGRRSRPRPDGGRSASGQRGGRTAPDRRHPRSGGHRHLHLRHHRPAQGLCDQPRQLHGGGGQHRRQAGNRSSTPSPATRRPRCCSCRSRTSSAGWWRSLAYGGGCASDTSPACRPPS